MALRVLHADDHPIVRRGCRAILERDGFAVVAEAGDGSEAIALARLHRPDAALLDIGLPIVAGFDVARALAEVTPTTRVLMLTVRGDEATILAALQMGIRGYVAKSHAGRELAAAIRAVLVGGVFVSPDLRRGAVEG